MKSNNLFKLLLFLLLALAAASPEAAAETLRFPTYNFSIELPSTWTLVKPTPIGALAVADNPSGSSRMILLAKSFRPTDLNGVRNGLKKDMVEKGVTLQPDQEFKIGDRPFVLIFGHWAAGNSTLANYLTGTEGEVITIAFSIKGVPTTSDPDIDSMVRSLKFLSHAPIIPVSPPPPAAK